MKKIKTYHQHITNNQLMPLNFKLLHEIHFSNYQLPYYIYNKCYQNIYFQRDPYFKPLSIV
jgi:hypothetical protein